MRSVLCCCLAAALNRKTNGFRLDSQELRPHVSVYVVPFQINKPCFLKKELVTFEYALKTEQGLVPSHIGRG